MGKRAESMEQHRSKLNNQYQREEEYKDQTDWLELKVLFRYVHL